MHEYSGSLQAIELSSTLWLIPLLPLLVAAVSALKCTAPDEDRPVPLQGRWYLGGVLGALLLLVVELVQLWGLPADRRFLLDTLGSVLRVGSLDVPLSLSLDPLSAAVALVVAVCGAAVIAHNVLPGAHAEPATARRFEALSLGVGSMLLLVLASNLVVLLIGWGGVSLAGYLLVASEGDGATRGRAAFAMARFADLALLCGVALLFWTLGGAWSSSGEYTPDFRARIVAVQRVVGGLTDKNLPKPDEAEERAAPRAEPSGLISLNSLPGATLRVGGAELCAIGDDGKRGGIGVPSMPCRVVARAPFERLPVPVALHDFRIDLGPGNNPLAVEKVRVRPGALIELGLTGSTLDFREMRDQLRMRDKSGSFALRADLLSKRIEGLPALTLALILIVLAALAKSAEWPLGAGATRGESMLLGGGGLVAGVYLLARLGFYLPLAPAAAGLAALLGSLTALLAGLGVLLSRDPRRIVVGFGVGLIGLVFLAIGSGALAAGVLELVVVVPAVTLLLLASADLEYALGAAPDVAGLGGLGAALPGTARAWSIAALAAAAAPYPALGAFWSRESLLWSAFTGHNTGFAPGALLVLLGVLGSAALCFAVWRAYYLLFTGKASRDRRPLVKDTPPVLHTRLLLGLGWFSLLVGLSGVSDRVLDSASPSWPALFDVWLAPLVRTADLSFDDLGTGMRLGLLLVGFGVPLLAWSVARRRYGPGRAADWEAQERRIPGSVWLDRGDPLPRLLAPFGRGVLALGTVLAHLDGMLAFEPGIEPDEEESTPRSAETDEDESEASDEDESEASDEDESEASDEDTEQ